MSITPEIWKPVARTLGAYEVSSLGRVRNRMTQNIRKPFVRKSGHHAMYLQAKGIKPVCLLVHSMVLSAFAGERPADMVGRHLNGDPADNRLCNLAWGTHAENSKDAALHGRGPLGVRNPRATLTEADVLAIRSSQQRKCDLARAFGVTQTHIASILSRKTWQHV